MKNKNIKIGILSLSLLMTIGVSAQNEADPQQKQQKKKVALGYDRQDEDKVVASVSSITSEQLMRSYGSATNLGDALYGLLPGLIVTQGSGAPGGDTPRLLIRGRSTYNGTGPLILVDGFEADYSRLSISEVESISVMKDAASTAIYGLKGANGVILITTKRGDEEGYRIEAKAVAGIKFPMQLPEFLNSNQYTSLYNQALELDGLAPMFEPDMYPGGATPGDKNFYPDNDFMKELMRPAAPMYTGGIQVDGRSKKIGYYVNFDYLYNEGHFKHTDKNDNYSTQASQSSINVRTNLDIDVIKNLEMDVDLGFQYDTRKAPGAGVEDIWNSITQTPPMLYNMINPDNSLGGTTDYRNNPYALITAKGYQKNLMRTINATFRAQYHFDWLLQGLSAGFNASLFDYAYVVDNKTKDYAVYAIAGAADGEENPYTYQKYGDETPLKWGTGHDYYRRANFEANIRYGHSFGDHTVGAMGIFRLDRLSKQMVHEKPSHMGFSGRVNYDYKNKYIAEFVFSYQGSEVFHPDNRYGFFPAAALGWIASEESFIKDNASWLSFLKFRASYGVSGYDGFITGKDVADRIFYNQYYGGLGGYNFGEDAGSAKGGWGELRLANKDLTWEKSYKFDAGIDVTVFNSLSLGFTYYNDDRKDIFTADGNLPALIGTQSKPYTNNGRVVNKGYETYIRYSKQFRDLYVSVGLNLDHNRNEIKQKGDEPFYTDANLVRIGHPVGQPFALISQGLYDGTSPYLPQAWGNLQQGDVLYADVNGDKVVNDQDLAAIGYTSIPEYVFSMNVNLRYKGFDLFVLAEGVDNVSTILGGQFIPFRDKTNAYSNVYDSWVPGKTDAKFPRLTTLDNKNNHRSSSLWQISNDFIKLRNVELGYTLPSKAMKSLRLQSARVFVRGVNLLTLSRSFDILDPETMGGYPSMRSCHVGLNVKF